MRIFEITRIPDYKEERDWASFSPHWFNDDYEIHDQKGPMEVRVYRTQGMIRIVGLIEDQIMAYLTLMGRGNSQYEVQAVQVDSRFRGKGVAPYFYSVALEDLGIILLSDDVQTRGGSAIWDKLKANPKYTVDLFDLSKNQVVANDNSAGNSVRLRARLV